MNHIMQLEDLETVNPSEDKTNIVLYKARASLGIESFGFSFEEFEPGTEGIEHDHSNDGQEELYFCLQGDGAVQFDGGDWQEFNTGSMIHVDADTRRLFRAGETGLMLCIVSGSPESEYSKVMPEWSELTKGEEQAGEATSSSTESETMKEGETQTEKKQS